MWPGQQPPGGEQNQQQPNPYQQPGYQQPNPYQQPGHQGHQQPNPYQPPGQWGPPGPLGGKPDGPGGGGSKRNAVIAVVASLAVIAATAATGFFLLREDGGDSADGPSASAGAPGGSEEEEQGADDEENGRAPNPDSPRGSSDEPKPDPVVDGWEVVVNPKHHSAFDVPEGWKAESPGTIVGWGEKEDEDAMFATPQVAMSAPAYFMDGYCSDTSSRAVVGTKGAQGSRNTKEAALNAARSFVFYRHGEEKDKLDDTGSETFSNSHGIKGHIATATMTGVDTSEKCDADGKAVAISWLDSSRDLRLWVLITDAGVDDEVPEATIEKMTESLRPYNESD